MPTLHVRNVPKDLHERLQALAQSRNRSMSAQVLNMLSSAVEEEELRQSRSRILSSVRRRRFTYVQDVPDSATLLREDRER
jgi:plasmid stability protein